MSEIICSIRSRITSTTSTAAMPHQLAPLFARRRSLLRLAALAIVGLMMLTTASGSAKAQTVRSGAAQTGVGVLKGSVTGAVVHATDSGRMVPTTRLQNLTLNFAKTAAQKTDLATLIHDQQDASSPLFHHWLAAAEYKQRFGASAADMARAVSWLQGQGFTIVESTPLHVRFSGAASQVESAFKTQMHQYKLGTRSFYSNASDITIPEGLSGLVLSIGNLDSFRPAPQHKAPKAALYSPNLTTKSGTHYTVPADIQTIYDVNALYTAGYTGAGQTLVVVGQSAIDTTDLNAFHTVFGGNLNLIITLVPFSGDSVIASADDEEESDLDIEYSGSIAKDATVNFVYTGDEDNYGAFDAIQYAIENNLAPVISISYGGCESDLGSSTVQQFASTFDQGLAQGQTLIAASGDTGATACDRNDFTPIAQDGLTVQFPSDAPEVTGIGGTEFNEGTGTYWSATDGTGLGSALSYIPEVVWNDTNADGFAASGGGASMYFTKPDWQTGTGVPADNARDIPDISLDASNAHDGYFFCGAADSNGNNCSDGYVYISGGTSFGAPIFSGMLTLINQASASTGMGNINPLLYPMVTTTPAAFHDIVTGNNDSPCSEGSTDCPMGTTEIGFNAGTGYDQATGLGSVDVYQLAQAFPGYGTGTPLSATKTVLTYAPATPNAGANITFTSTVTGAGGTPTGNVTFFVDGNDVADSMPLAAGVTTYISSPLSAGTHSVTAQYFGDSIYATSAASVTLPVTPLPPTAVALSISPSAPTAGTPVNVVAGVTSGIAGTITGTVDFSVDGNDTNNPITLAKGVVSLTLPSFTAGAHNITAQYSGDSNYAPGNGLVAFNIVALAADNVTLSMSPSAPTATDTVSVSAVLSSGATGSVQFLLDGTASGTAITVAGSKATSTFGPLAAGSHTITANYTGDGTFAASTSSVSFVVSSSAAAFTLSASSVTLSDNQSGDSTVTVTSPNDYAGTINLAISGSGPQGACFLINNNPTVAAHASATAVIAIYVGTACTTATSAANHAAPMGKGAPGSGLPFSYLPTTVATLAGCLLLGFKRKSRAWKSLLGVVLLGMLGMTIGCSGGGSTAATTTAATPAAGTYTLTVTGTDSATAANTASTTFTLTVK